jgi:hypothetical protein
MSIAIQFLKRLSLIFICFGATCGNVIESFRNGEVKNATRIRQVQAAITVVAAILVIAEFFYQCFKKKTFSSTHGEIFSTFLGIGYVVASTIVYYVTKVDKDFFDNLSILLHMATAVGLFVQSWAWGWYRSGPNYQSVTMKATFT